MKKLLFAFPIVVLLAVGCSSQPTADNSSTSADQTTQAQQPTLQQNNIQSPAPSAPTSNTASFHCPDVLSDSNASNIIGWPLKLVENYADTAHRDLTCVVNQYRTSQGALIPMQYQVNVEIETDKGVSDLNTEKIVLPNVVDIPNLGSVAISTKTDANSAINWLVFVSSNGKNLVLISYKALASGTPVDAHTSRDVNHVNDINTALQIAKVVDANLSKY